MWSYADRFRSLVASITAAAPPPSPKTAVATARTLVAALAASAVLFGGAARAQTSPAPPAPPTPATNEIRFGSVVDENKGHVICALFRKEGWLKEPVQWKRAPIRERQAECVFTSVTPDVYGISAFHDENDNQKLDTNFLGIPTESWCTSRGAKAYFGPPSFDDAKFRYNGGVMRHRADLR